MLKVLTLALLPSVTLCFHKKRQSRDQKNNTTKTTTKTGRDGIWFAVLTFKDVDPGEKIRLLRTGLVLYDNRIYLKIFFNFKTVSTWTKNLLAHTCIRGHIKSGDGKLKLAQSYSPFKSHFVGALNNVLNFLQKMFSTTKIGRFLRRFSVVEFSAVDFLDFFQNKAFLWFDFRLMVLLIM